MKAKQEKDRTIGKILKSYRERSGISQLDLSEKAGVSSTSVADIERGAIKDPRISTLVSIAEALELTPKESADLMGINLYKAKPSAKQPKVPDNTEK
ncbi:helix-turn-helix domain-containing protein [Candidatus Dojkabacteria bacterium]|nr:helix-turn-helix domain-containing protein [Candidatus Dojkabacteria bacterium]